MDQINYYLLVSFKEPIEYCQIIFQLNQNIFFIIVIITLYIWIICLIINLIIFYKVIIQLTEPIKKLQEAIESSSIKDENIFKYEYDEFINDLFLTSKELLTGQIDNNNNEKGLGKFNILSIPKDKQSIDKNLYQKNLIINNDIINKLIKEQENMMDFSKNIKVNEELDDDNEKENEINLKRDKNNNDIKNNNNEILISEIKEEKNNNADIKQNKIKEEEEDREPYKKLFKISEYLDYYKNKIENNYIHIVNNEIKDESRTSNISKISNNLTANSSLNINSKLKKSIIKGDNYGKGDDYENMSINMLDNKNITYLWYSIAKKKKNKSLNYQISNNYGELFMEDNTYHQIYK